jgi:hypothetical protein
MPRVLVRPWLHPVHPESSENVICDKMFFSRKINLFVLEHYFSTRSYAECQNAFRNFFPDSVVPNKYTIQRLVKRFRETGSTGEKHCSGRPSVLSNDSLEYIRARLLQSQRKSLRRLSQQTGMTYGSVQRAAKRLKLHPYWLQVCHELKEIGKEKRMCYCRWFQQFFWNGVDILQNVFFPNEAWFHLSGYVNSQNSRFWSNENPHLFHEVHSQKIGCWCAIYCKWIVRPTFFSETVTAEKYQEIIM